MIETERTKVFESEEDFLANGGDRLQLDLAMLVKDRVTDAVSSVMQLLDGSDPKTGMTAQLVMGHADATALALLYGQTCLTQGVVVPPDEFLEAVRPLWEMLLTHYRPQVEELLKEQEARRAAKRGEK